MSLGTNSYRLIYKSSIFNFLIFFSYSVCTTVACITSRWRHKFVDKVRSTVLYTNIVWVSATGVTITKADLPAYFTVFHCRMSTIQPAWPVCTTSECWHMCCWHFCSWSSHKTIPFLRELIITQHWSRWGRSVATSSIGIAQFFIHNTRIGYKVKWTLENWLQNK